MNQQIKLAVFDLAGTTVKDDNAVRDCLYKAAVQYDLKATPDEIANLMGTNKIHLYQFLIAKNQGRIMDFRGFEEDIFEDTYELAKKIYDCYVEIMIDYYRHDCQEIEGASKVFEWCHKNDIKVATDTGFHSDVNQAIFDCLGWTRDGLVDCAVDLDMVPEGKGAEDNVVVKTGNAEAGFVALSQCYKNGAFTGGSGWIVPQELYNRIDQDAVLLKKGEKNQGATRFLKYLKESEDAARIRETYGYGSAQ